MKIILSMVTLCLAASSALAQGDSQGVPQDISMMEKPLSENTVKVSDHVWAIIGFPNIGIVAGKTATLVVDTGLGKTNGQIIAKVIKKLAPHNRVYLTTTHFHPEHASGAEGFPAGTLLIRDQVQQDEMDKNGEEMIKLFAGRNEHWKKFLANNQLRSPDVVFDKSLKLDLGGGVTARLLWFGGAHTKGDELIFVDPDKTLISGDVVQNKIAPHIYGDGGTPSSWIAVLGEIEKLGATHVLPDHTPIGDGSMIEQYQSFLIDLQTRALALKKEGKTEDQAGPLLTNEFAKKYPDWNLKSLSSYVKNIYDEQ